MTELTDTKDDFIHGALQHIGQLANGYPEVKDKEQLNWWRRALTQFYTFGRPEKLCPKCKEWKVRDEFRIALKRPGGLAGWCIKCQKKNRLKNHS